MTIDEGVQLQLQGLQRMFGKWLRRRFAASQGQTGSSRRKTTAHLCVRLWRSDCTCVAALQVALADSSGPLGDLRGQGVEWPSYRFKAFILLFVYEVCQLGLLCLEGYDLGSLQSCCPVLSASGEQTVPIFGLHSSSHETLSGIQTATRDFIALCVTSQQKGLMQQEGHEGRPLCMWL